MGSLRRKHGLSEALEPWDSEEVLTREGGAVRCVGFFPGPYWLLEETTTLP